MSKNPLLAHLVDPSRTYARPLRAPFDNAYLIGLVWQVRRQNLSLLSIAR